MAPQESPAKNWFVERSLSSFGLSRCVTWNNYPEDWEVKLTSVDQIKYWVAGKEVSETGTPHLQMYIQLKKKLRTRALQTVIQAAGIQASLLKAKGTLAVNQVYCKKDGDWKEKGEATGKGRRSDVLALRDAVLSGKGDLDLAMDDSTCRASAQFARFTELLRSRQREKTAKEALTASLEDKPLKQWQTDAVAVVDGYDFGTTLVWSKDEWGCGCFIEFGCFCTHSFP